MKNIIRLEEFALFTLSAYALIVFDAAWWWFPLLLLGPDISMMGYLAGNKTGAISYNLFHHKAIAVLVFIAGFTFGSDPLQLIGIVLFGHSAMDRTLGYGLKLNEGFKHTHLGITGKK
jgi:hypothetical protein